MISVDIDQFYTIITISIVERNVAVIEEPNYILYRIIKKDVINLPKELFNITWILNLYLYRFAAKCDFNNLVNLRNLKVLYMCNLKCYDKTPKQVLSLHNLKKFVDFNFDYGSPQFIDRLRSYILNQYNEI